MHHDLERLLHIGGIVELIYVDQASKISMRKVKLIAIDQDTVHAFCYTRGAPRNFRIDHILAIGYPSQTKRKST